ncbi:MAG: FAD-dependent oxidoreductase [Gemmatimonadaceae bacterium]|nr:FAD-dependent oxidoreductase [Gemmatimonadaceae bacterium]
MNRHDVDVLIIGSGFSGSLLAMILRKLGRTVALIERGRHPRFAIGESSTPLASLLVEEISRQYHLPVLMPFTKHGVWTRERPEVGCGLKRGFSFFSHQRGQPFAADPMRGNQLLVAASPNDEVGDVHWYRADFDHFLVAEAVRSGAEYRDHAEITNIALAEGNSVADGRDEEGAFQVRARLVIDATGPRGFLHRSLSIGTRQLPGVPATEGLYSHFTGVRRFADVAPGAFRGGPPYAPDVAATQHILDGGWIWVLPFDNGITSVGLAATAPLAAELRLSDGAAAWGRLLALYPSLHDQFAGAAPTREFTWAPQLAFASEQAAGAGWAMLPSAAGIVDPLLSTGFPLTLLGVQRVAAAVSDHWGSPTALSAALSSHAVRTGAELDVTARLVGALYGAFSDWPRFTALSHLYFTAATYTESARRLGKPGLAGDGFMMSGHPTFGPAYNRCLSLAASGASTDAVIAAVRDATEPVNVAGLLDDSRHNWYPCNAASMLAGAAKLDSAREEVAAMLQRCGFRP